MESSSAAYTAGKFSLQRPKMPQRARVLPSSFLWPFFTSIIEKTCRRVKRLSVPLNDSSRGGTERPRYTMGAVAHGTTDSFSLPVTGSASEHIGFEVAPVVRLYVTLRTRRSNQANAG